MAIGKICDVRDMADYESIANITFTVVDAATKTDLAHSDLTDDSTIAAKKESWANSLEYFDEAIK